MDIFNYCQLKFFEFNKNDYCITTSLFNILIYFLIFFIHRYFTVFYYFIKYFSINI